jgi:hypothetical protein
MAAVGHGRDPAAPSSEMPFLVRLYPGAWRARYGEEFAELLAARPPRVRDQLDIVRAAIDARIQAQVFDAPVRREVTAGDRALAAAGVLVGGLFSMWAGIIVSFSPRWDEAGTAGNDLLALSYGLGLLGAVVAVAVLLGLIYRHIGDLRSPGTIGALLSAGGFLAMAGSDSSSAAAVLLIVFGTLVMSPGLARAVGRPVTAFVVGSTVFLASAMFGFVGSGGQELLWLWMLAGYGPSWMLLGLSLRRGPHVTIAAPVGA